MLLKINFDNVYAVKKISEDLNTVSFRTELIDGSTPLLQIKINSKEHELFSNVFNLAFGPLDHKGRIDDKANLPHRDYSKVFSTILLEAYAYLERNPGRSLGIDGSDNRRAYLYHRFILGNFDYLNQHFNMYGLKYYVRITRSGKHQYHNLFDFGDIHTKPILLKKDDVLNAALLYNYYVFNLK